MYSVTATKKFRKSLKKYKKSGRFDEVELDYVVRVLASGKKLPKKYKDHKLHGTMQNLRECHLAPNLLLAYRIIENELVLVLFGLGNHSDLFE